MIKENCTQKTIHTGNMLVEIGKKLDIDCTINEAINLYKETEEEMYLCYIYKKIYPLILNISRKYYMLTDPDKESLSLLELMNAISKYDEKRDVKFTTLFTTYFKRSLFREARSANYMKNKVNIEAASYEDLLEQGFDKSVETEYEVELIESLPDNLTKTEDKYIKLLIHNPGILDKEAADKIGVSPSNIYYVKRNLKEKLDFLLN